MCLPLSYPLPHACCLHVNKLKSPAAGFLQPECRSPIKRCSLQERRAPRINSCRAADATRNHQIMRATGVTAAARARFPASRPRSRYKTGVVSWQQLHKGLANNGISDYLSRGPFLVAPAGTAAPPRGGGDGSSGVSAAGSPWSSIGWATENLGDLHVRRLHRRSRQQQQPVHGGES